MEESDEVKKETKRRNPKRKNSSIEKEKKDADESAGEIKFPKPPRKRKPQSFMCEECGKLFNRADLLRNHKRVHTGDKPFSCEVCGDKFREQGHLRRHMSRHTGKKPYQCYICGKELNSSLAKHLRRHLNDRQFSCVLCDKKFVSGFELKQHLLTHKKGTFQENSKRGTPSLHKREPKLYKALDAPANPEGPLIAIPATQQEMMEANIASSQETSFPFHRSLAVPQGDQLTMNQISDHPDPALVNWDYLSYAAAVELTQATPTQPLRGKASGRKRLSDLSWDISQSNQKLSQQHQQAATQLDAKEEVQPPAEGEKNGTVKDSDEIQKSEELAKSNENHHKESEMDVQNQSVTDKEHEVQSVPVTHPKENPEEETESPACSSTCPSQEQTPPNSTESEIKDIQSDAFTKVKHLTISVKEEPLDVDTENSACLDNVVQGEGLSDDDNFPADFSDQDDSGSITDDYEAEAYFQKLDDSLVLEEKIPEDKDWTPDSDGSKKSLKVKIKTPKQASKRKASKKGGENEVPKKRGRKRKKTEEVEEGEEEEEEEEEELPTTVCTDSNTLFVISPDKKDAPGSKKKRSSKKDQVFVCEECGKVFFRNDLLKNHMRVHTGDKPFTCEVCGESFRESGHLRRHMTRHTGKKPYKCDLCGKELNSSLAKHLKRHMNDRQFPCTMCDKKFVSGFELKHHMIIHNTSDHIPCHICGRKFSHTNILQRHMLTHSDNRPFPCPDCDKSYKCKQDLDRHRSIHKEVFTATCHICGKQFCQDRYLYRHLKRHQQLKEEGIDETERSTKFKPFSCEVCHQRFTTAPNLKQHMHLHYSTEKFACYLCSKMFTQKRYLQRHIRRHKQNRIKGFPSSMDDTDLLMGHMVATFNEQGSKRHADKLVDSTVFERPDSPDSLEEGEVLNQSTDDQEMNTEPEPEPPGGQEHLSKPVFPSADSEYENDGEDTEGSEEEGVIPPNYLNIMTQPPSLALAQPQT